MSELIGKFHERKALLRRAVVTKGRDVDRAQVVEELRAILVEQLGVDASEVTEASSFQEDLNADSLDLVELIMEMEDRFKLKIPDEDAEKISTVGEAVDYVVANAS
jgi:acyl carrier protein